MKVYILYTGGTIGCVGTPLSPMDGETFSAAFEKLMLPTITAEMPNAQVDIGYFDHTLDSTNMQPSEWVLMASRIAAKYASYDAFLVLHGTDTMAWTSSALSFLLPGLSKSVTVSGSQLPLFTQLADDSLEILYNTDAMRNVLGAIKFFEMEVPEVCLYFADKMFRGNRAVKSNSSQFVAFSSPNYPALGEYGVVPTLNSALVLPVPGEKSLSKPKNLLKVLKDLHQMSETIKERSVLQIQTFPGYYSDTGDCSLIASMMQCLKNVKPKLAGIVFESYGIGNIPSFSSMQKELRSLHDEGVVLVDCTQVFQGGVNYNEYATGAWLKEVGVISGQDMTAIATMAKLTVLLACNPTATQDDIELAMSEVIAGEMASTYSLAGGAYLAPDESLFSINGQYEFANTTEGYIKIYDVSEDTAVEHWSQGTGANGRLKMQADNNLVYYDEKKNVSWQSDTAELGFSSYIKIGNDGSLRLYDATDDSVVSTIYAGPGGEPKKRVRKQASRPRNVFNLFGWLR